MMTRNRRVGPEGVDPTRPETVHRCLVQECQAPLWFNGRLWICRRYPGEHQYTPEDLGLG